MDHHLSKNIHLPKRFGFHYFPDCQHYSDSDIQSWLPALQEINAQWLVIKSPANRGIPEDFIRRFSENGMKLVVDFNYPLGDEIDWHDLILYLSSYGKWGIRYAMLNQQPNMQSSWTKGRWGNPNLITGLMDQFTKFGQICLENSIRPVFPLLTPGGDYWDLAFLRNALEKLHTDAPNSVINNFILSAAAWEWGKHLDWGAGGQENWPLVKPYKLPLESQNQQGFRTYEWYSSIAKQVFGRPIPILLLQAGIQTFPADPETDIRPAATENLHAIYRLLKGENVFDPIEETHLFQPINPEVIGCCFYLLSSESLNHQDCRWFSSDGQRLTPAQAIFVIEQKQQSKAAPVEHEQIPAAKNFQHNRYILISKELEKESRLLIEMLQPFIEKHKPEIGFSMDEAKKSAAVLVIAPPTGSTPPDYKYLMNNGNLVKVIRPGEIPDYLKEQNYAVQ